MATLEKDLLLSTKNDNGDLLLLYPITTTENVDGLSENYAPKEHTHSTVNGFTVESNVPANAKFTDTTYSVATSDSDGLISKDDKKKLDAITYTFGKDTNGFYIEQII